MTERVPRGNLGPPTLLRIPGDSRLAGGSIRYSLRPKPIETGPVDGLER